MTRQPWTVQVDDSLAVARRMFAEREVHHLPVLDGDQLVGILTARDANLAADRLATVGEVMLPVHPVSPDDSLADVLDLMMAKHCDAVVCTDERGVEGIFTAADALRLLAERVHRRAA